MVGGKGGDGGEAADRGEGADAELHHERYGREKMRGEGGAMLAERVGRVVVGLVTCQGSWGRGEASCLSIPNTLCDPSPYVRLIWDPQKDAAVPYPRGCIPSL